MKKSNIKWLSRTDLVKVVKKNIFPVKTVLDIGCGIIPQTLVPTKTSICVEPYGEYVTHLLRNYPPFSRHKYLIIQTDWKGILPLIPNKSIDTIILTDVIEHLSKIEGQKLLKQTVPLARKQIIIGAPIGLTKQFHVGDKDAWGYSGVKWQDHKSGWDPDDFGSDWDIYACKEFHVKDNLGRITKHPGGAFFAIKNITYTDTRGTIKLELEIFIKQLIKRFLTNLYYMKQRLIGEAR